MSIVSKLFSAGAKRPLAKYERMVKHINELEPEYTAMSDEELMQRNEELKKRAKDEGDSDWVRDNAMALLREHIKRQDGRRAYDVQIIAALAIWHGDAIEASTGSGKTLISHFPAYLAALCGQQTHIVTVNEYLTMRDADEERRIMSPLGFTVGRIYNQQPNDAKKIAYSANVVYGTPSEFGFDYLRDNMVQFIDQKVQTRHDFAIIDEVDSILIDEARTPLIISGEGESPAATYRKFAKAVRGLVPYDETTDLGDYIIDESKKEITPTDTGLDKIEKKLGFKVYADDSGSNANHLLQAMKAEYLFHNEKDYVIIDGQVKIVDEHTGRIMEGRQWSNGLHQAIEAKEGVKISDESQTMATCTLQNYFRMYKKLSGMTGTGLTEATEFRETYGIETIGIPDNKPCIRKDETDVVYATADAKYAAIADEIERVHKTGQPILAGTASVESSEHLSKILDGRKIPHTVLNAKHHEREAHIVAQAGRLGAVTIATNMAGRGTDIKLGGDPDAMAADIAQDLAATRWANMTVSEHKTLGEAAKQPTAEEQKQALEQAREICDAEKPKVVAAGGLYVLGTERHESRRIDNQLRGRSGRQGDPGCSRFFISLDDDLLRLFGDNKLQKLQQVAVSQGMADQPVEFKMVAKAIESAQHKIEQIHYEERKNTLDYDDVINKQRKLIYAERDAVLKGENLEDKTDDIIYDNVTEMMDQYATDGKSDKWDEEGMRDWWSYMTGRNEATGLPTHDATGVVYGFASPVSRKDQEPLIRKALRSAYDDARDNFYQYCSNGMDREAAWQNAQRSVMLATIDNAWRKHLSAMEYLRTGIGLRGVGQRDPKVEYKHDAKEAFDILVDRMYDEYLHAIIRLDIKKNQMDMMSENMQRLRLTYTQPMDPDADANDNPHNPGRHMPITNGAAVPMAPAGVYAGLTGSGRLYGGTSKTYRKADDPNPYVGVGRNDPCPCGSGKKFKYCHGRNMH